MLFYTPKELVYGILIVAFALIVRFRKQIIEYLTILILSTAALQLRKDPEKYDIFIERLIHYLLPHLDKIMPHLTPLLPPDLVALIPQLLQMLGTKRITQAMRIGSYISVEYLYRQRNYTALLPYQEGSDSVWLKRAIATTGRGEKDVTARIMEFAGPVGDFHGLRVKPKDMIRDCALLRLDYSDNTTIEVAGTNIIELNDRPRTLLATL